METKGFMAFIINVGNWIVHLAYLNLLWILHSIMGLLILGVFPATAGLFSVIRQWLKHGNIPSAWDTFHSAFKKSFVQSNTIGYLYLIIGLVTYVDFKFLQTQGIIIFTILSYTVLVLLVIYGVMGLFLFPVFVHYDLNILSYFKYTFLIIVAHPLNFLLTVLVLSGVFSTMIFIPGLLTFYGLSISGYIIMFSAYRAFNKVDYQSSAA